MKTDFSPEYAEQYLNEQKERFTPFITELQIDAIKSSQVSFCLIIYEFNYEYLVSSNLMDSQRYHWISVKPTLL